HKDMETYFLAKKKLFTKTYLSGRAVINADDAYGRRLMAENPGALTYGRESDAAVRLRSLRNIPGGMIIVLSTPQDELLIRTHLLGDINGYNIMAAAGAAMALGIDRETIIKGIEELEQVPGRMEPVRNPQGLNILVDYAHTPDALNHALTSARAMTKGRLITIFGCGGDRDRTKRPLMGAIAAGISDLVIVTSDNPRSEDPRAIIDEILKGIPDMTYVSVEPDREEAIRLGIHSIMEDDCLIIAGKGHENYQIIGKEKTRFDDRECVLKCLREIYRT
ncbi:UDP-N-acetylmuramoyl-L-alanyl-D-glutamate--2,6-diaminopimelate ligase, partial [bacterium]|nr:UDP-N-acetylmuramoyl-L-alanyl-D-glutamate--2,6-diaminopimelate ligase [bacterium]